MKLSLSFGSINVVHFRNRNTSLEFLFPEASLSVQCGE